MLFYSTLVAVVLVATSVSAMPAVLQERAGPSRNFQPAGAVGCVTDSYPNSRTLNAGYSTANTICTCLTYCAGQGTHYAGLENGNQCFCGPSLDFDAYVTQGADGLTLSNNGGCTTPCAGNSTQNCGGSNRLLIFESSVFPVPTHATVDGFDYQGCFPDHVNQRLLPTFVSSSDSSLTTAKCLHACAARGYDLAGLEYSTQCLCGSSSSVTLSDTAGPTNCEYSCSGARAEVCGGASFLDIYKATSNNGNVPKTIQNVQTAMGTYDYQGCYTDRSDSQGRALQTYSSSGSQTVENCVASCAAGNYIYAAAEYGSECRCGNRLASFSKNTPTCDMPCSGASGELCGGQNYAMSLYKLE